MSQQVDIAEPRRQSAPDGLAITVAFEVKAGSRDRFLKLVRANAAASLEAEAECLRFDVLLPVAAGQPDVLLYEIYTDRSAFDTHLASPHFLEFDAATRDMVIKKTISEFMVEAPRPT